MTAGSMLLRLAGRTVTLPHHPVYTAGRDVAVGSELLLAGTEGLAPGTPVCALNMAADPAVPELSRTFRLTLVEEHLAALRYARALLAANGVDGATAPDLRFADLTADPPDERYGAVLVNLRYLPDKAVLRDCLRWAAALLEPGGRLLLAGANDRGVRSAERLVGEYFADVEVALFRKGHRLLVAREPRPAPARPHPEQAVRELTVRGVRLLLEEAPGVFAGGKPDEGNLLLAGWLPAPAPGAAVLDLACGSGMLGILLARLGRPATVVCADEFARAVELCRRNAARNGVNAVVVASDGFSELGGRRFDLIALNPPFHFGAIQTPEPARRLIREAAAHLEPGGELWLVANRFLPYEATMREAFPQVQQVHQTNRFKVLRGVARQGRGR